MIRIFDNKFYPSAERIQFVFASLSRPAIDLQKMAISVKKKSSFQMKLILILAGV